jgi:hypothetical protein
MSLWPFGENGDERSATLALIPKEDKKLLLQAGYRVVGQTRKLLLLD